MLVSYAHRNGSLAKSSRLTAAVLAIILISGSFYTIRSIAAEEGPTVGQENGQVDPELKALFEDMEQDLQKEFDKKLSEADKEFQILLEKEKEDLNDQMEAKIGEAKKEAEGKKEEFFSKGTGSNGYRFVEVDADGVSRVDCEGNSQCDQDLDELNQYLAVKEAETREQSSVIIAEHMRRTTEIYTARENMRDALVAWKSDQRKKRRAQILLNWRAEKALSKPMPSILCQVGCLKLGPPSGTLEAMKSCRDCCWSKPSQGCQRPALKRADFGTQTLTNQERQKKRIQEIRQQGFGRGPELQFKPVDVPPPKFAEE